MSAKILLVDDEKGILEAFGGVLQIHGYQVLTAESVQEAKEQFEKTPFDLVLTDYDMPKENGMSLYEWVKKRNPNQRVVIISGKSPKVPDDVEMYVKPVPARKVIEIIDEVMAQAGN